MSQAFLILSLCFISFLSLLRACTIPGCRHRRDSGSLVQYWVSDSPGLNAGYRGSGIGSSIMSGGSSGSGSETRYPVVSFAGVSVAGAGSGLGSGEGGETNLTSGVLAGVTGSSQAPRSATSSCVTRV